MVRDQHDIGRQIARITLQQGRLVGCLDVGGVGMRRPPATMRSTQDRWLGLAFAGIGFGRRMQHLERHPIPGPALAGRRVRQGCRRATS